MTPDKQAELKRAALHMTDAQLATHARELELALTLRAAFDTIPLQIIKAEQEKRRDVRDKVRQECQNNSDQWDW